MPEDMTIPLFAAGDGFVPGGTLKNASIMDIAPTIANILGVPEEDEWEGKKLL
jgi:arylsulfatase A-like enzyme